MSLPTPESLEFEKRELITDPVRCLQAVSANGLDLRLAAAQLKTDVLCRLACKQTGGALAFVPAALKTRKLCLLAARHGTQVHFVPWHLLDEELTQVLVRHNGNAFSSLPKRWQTDITVAAAINSGSVDSVELHLQSTHAALLALEEDVGSCAKVPAYLFTQAVFDKAQALYGTHPQWPLLVAKHKPQVLIGDTAPTLGSDTFRKIWACYLDADMCITALRAGDALYRLPRHLLTREVSMAAFALDTFNLTWIPPAHMTRAMCELALQTTYGRLLSVVPEHLLTPDLCLIAVEANENALEFVPAALRTMSLYVATVKKYPKAISYVPTALRYEVLTQLIAQDPENASNYHLRRAAVAAAQRDFARAVADCDEVITTQPTLAEAYFLRAGALHDLGQWRAAFQDAQTVIALNDTYPWANNLLGLLFECAGCPGDLPDAIAAFGREIKIQPEAVKPLLNRAELYLKQGHGHKATADLNAALRLQADNHRGLYLRGYLAYEAGDVDAARADLTAATEALHSAHTAERPTGKPAGQPIAPYPPDYALFAPAVSACTAADPEILGAPRNAQQWRKTIASRPALIKLLPNALREAALYDLAVAHDPHLVMHVPATLMTPHFYAVAVALGRITMAKVPGHQLSEKIWLAAVNKQSLRLENIPDKWRTLAVCVAAYKASPSAIDHVPDALLGQVYAAAGKGWLERLLDASLRNRQGVGHWARAFQVLKVFARSGWKRKQP
jgi:tetratricopeptide (TPR) repeat protein